MARARGLGGLIAAVFLGVRLAHTTAAWREAGQLSLALAREVSRFEREAKPGAALLLDVPAELHRAFLWGWAAPFAVRAPFTRTPLDARFVVVEPMPAYFRPPRWAGQPAIAHLAHVSVESWLIQIGDDGRTRRTAVPAEKLRAAAALFNTAPRQAEPERAWREFIDDLTKP